MALAASSFRLSGAQSAWFVFTDASGTDKIAFTNGRTFVQLLQGSIRNSAELAGGAALRTYNGATIRGSDIALDGNWGPNTYKGMWAVLNARNLDTNALNGVKLAAQAGGSTIPSIVMMIAATWLLLPSLGQRVNGMVRFPSGTVFPPYRSTAAGALGNVTIRAATAAEMAQATGSARQPATPGTHAQPATPGGSDQPATPGGGKDTSAPPGGSDGKTSDGGSDTSVPGGTTPPAPPAPPAPPGPGTTLPTGVRPGTVSTGTGLTAGPIIAIGVAIVAVGAIGYTLMQSPSAGGSRPAKARRSRR